MTERKGGAGAAGDVSGAAGDAAVVAGEAAGSARGAVAVFST